MIPAIDVCIKGFSKLFSFLYLHPTYSRVSAFTSSFQNSMQWWYCWRKKTPDVKYPFRCLGEGTLGKSWLKFETASSFLITKFCNTFVSTQVRQCFELHILQKIIKFRAWRRLPSLALRFSSTTDHPESPPPCTFKAQSGTVFGSTSRSILSFDPIFPLH